MGDAKLQIARTPLGPDLPQQLDPDFYREVLLHIARLEVERLLRERSALDDIERRAKTPSGNGERSIAVIFTVHRAGRPERQATVCDGEACARAPRKRARQTQAPMRY